MLINSIETLIQQPSQTETPTSLGTKVWNRGPRDATIVIVGEAPGEDEVRYGAPFVGVSGKELNTLLADAGTSRNECFVANVCKYRPPNNKFAQWVLSRTKGEKDREAVLVRNTWVKVQIAWGLQELIEDLEKIQPDLIIAAGNAALWALTGVNKPDAGIRSWRGSQLESDILNPKTGRGFKVIPIEHPASVLRNYERRSLAVHDLKRALKDLHNNGPWVCRPSYNFITRPGFIAVIDTLQTTLERLWAGHEVPLACDIETRNGHIACFGIGFNSLEAISIPFMDVERESGSYWTSSQELEIIQLLRQVLTHPGARIIWQNGIYDMQYVCWWWLVIPRRIDDTMEMQHVIFPGMLSEGGYKDLVTLSSLYCKFHQFWKEEGKEWAEKMDEDQLWQYNCKDCVVTYECWERLNELLDYEGLREEYEKQLEYNRPILASLLRGVAVNEAKRAELERQVEEKLKQMREWLEAVVGYPLNPKSPQQLQHFFYSQIGIKPIYVKESKGPSTGKKALPIIAKREPLLRPICEVILQHNTLKWALSSVIRARVGRDGRFRTSYMVAGTETFRLTSGNDVWGGGANAQTITEGKEES